MLKIVVRGNSEPIPCIGQQILKYYHILHLHKFEFAQIQQVFVDNVHAINFMTYMTLSMMSVSGQTIVV